jgi:hypothetical protein
MGRLAGSSKPASKVIKAAGAAQIDSNWRKEYIRYQLETYKNIKSSHSVNDIDEVIFCGICQNTVE